MKKKIKSFLAFLLGNKVFFLSMYYIRRLIYSQYIISVTYHDTPFSDLKSFEKQIIFFSKYFVNCEFDDLKNYLNGKPIFSNKPGLIITFDDGLNSNYLFAISILEKYGFTGYFMIPVGFIDSKPTYQKEFALKSLIEFSDKDGTEKIGMNWQDVSSIIKRGHFIGCHTFNHFRLSDSLTQSNLYTEIVDSKNKLELMLNKKIEIFTWVGGEEWAYSKSAFDLIKKAGYGFVFCTNCKPILSDDNNFFLERYHVDSFYNINDIRFAISGMYDLFYLLKRKRIYKKLNYNCLF